MHAPRFWQLIVREGRQFCRAGYHAMWMAQPRAAAVTRACGDVGLYDVIAVNEAMITNVTLRRVTQHVPLQDNRIVTTHRRHDPHICLRRNVKNRVGSGLGLATFFMSSSVDRGELPRGKHPGYIHPGFPSLQG